MKNSSSAAYTAKSIADPFARQRIAAEFVLRMLEKYGKPVTVSDSQNPPTDNTPKRDEEER